MERDFETLMKESQERTEELLSQVDGSNLEELLEAQGFAIEYDAGRDYLYFTIGRGPLEGVAVPRGVAVLIVDPDSHALRGVEIPFFSERLKERNGDAAEELIAHFTANPRVEFPPAGDRQRYSAPIRDLLAV